MEHFHLRAFFFGNELNIVDHKHVRAAVFFAEVDGRAALCAYRRDKVVDEFFAGNVKDFFVTVVFSDIVSDRVHNVRFPKSRAAVNKQRVVLLARFFGDRSGGGYGKLVTFAHDEIIKGVSMVKHGCVHLRSGRIRLDDGVLLFRFFLFDFRVFHFVGNKYVNVGKKRVHRRKNAVYDGSKRTIDVVATKFGRRKQDEFVLVHVNGF